MKKSVLKKLAVLGGVAGFVGLSYYAQKYVRLFVKLSSSENIDVESVTTDKVAANDDGSDLDELLKNGDAVRVKISHVNDDEPSDEGAAEME